MKMLRGCTEEVPEYTVVGEKVARCPLKICGRKYDQMFLTHSFLMNGMLPHSGGWGEQPNALIEGALFIDSEMDRLKEDAKPRR